MPYLASKTTLKIMLSVFMQDTSTVWQECVNTETQVKVNSCCRFEEFSVLS